MPYLAGREVSSFQGCPSLCRYNQCVTFILHAVELEWSDSGERYPTHVLHLSPSLLPPSPHWTHLLPHSGQDTQNVPTTVCSVSCDISVGVKAL